MQGVFFRESTRRVAEGLGITGYAINLDNGDVEVLAFGESTALDQLGRWLQHGPTMAVVQSVDGDETEGTPPAGFTTG